MSRRDWLFVFAVGGILIAGLFFAALVNQEHKRQENYQAAQEVYEQSKAKAPPGAIPERGVTDPTAYREEWRNEYDLGAQRDMAKYARLLLFVTAAGVIISCIGVFLIYETVATTHETLAEAKRSTEISERSLRSARIAAKASLRSVEVAKSAARAQSGSFIVVTGVRVVIGDRDDVIIKIDYKNCGATPAYQIAFGTQSKLCESLQEVFEPVKIELVGFVRKPLPPGAADTISITSNSINITRAGLRDAQKVLRLHGMAVWYDVFGEPSGYIFSYHFIPPVPQKRAREMYVNSWDNRPATQKELRRYRNLDD